MLEVPFQLHLEFTCTFDLVIHRIKNPPTSVTCSDLVFTPGRAVASFQLVASWQYQEALAVFSSDFGSAGEGEGRGKIMTCSL